MTGFPLRYERAVVTVGVVIVVLLAWIWLLSGAGMGMSAVDMTRMSSANMMFRDIVWTPAYAALMFAMWWVMMIAMMLPTAVPVLMLYLRMESSRTEGISPSVSTALFATGYVTVWGTFSLLATGLQWGLDRMALLSPDLALNNPYLAGSLLVLAGLWQLTPIKDLCLQHCRSPLGFLMHAWRSGPAGAFRMGLHHGGWCLGCCWFLMGLLFLGGVMNLFWIVGLMLFVLMEKMLPQGNRLGSLAGAAMVVWGMWLLAGI